MCSYFCSCFVELFVDHLYLHVLTHSFPTRRSSYLASSPVEPASTLPHPARASCIGPRAWLPATRGERHLCQRVGDHGRDAQLRSEEHTSELQSLMRISYAVFCLKKKNKTNKRKPQIKRKLPITNHHTYTTTI